MYVSHNLNSLQGVICGTITGATKGDTRSLDYIPYDIRFGVCTLGGEPFKMKGKKIIARTTMLREVAGQR